MLERIRIATRQSALALWQARFVADELRRVHPGLDVELVGLTTRGDRWLEAPLREVGGKGLFVKELELAMLDGRAEIAVHSMKDVPALLPPEFTLPVIGYREQVNDALLGPHGSLDALPAGATIGSSSLRRQAQILARRPDLRVRPIRGNVDTRLAKLDRGEFDAIVLAAAGLNRLQLRREDRHDLSPEQCLPAPGQAALGIECLRDSPVRELLDRLGQAATAACVHAERAVSAGLGADCSLPVAAFAETDGDGLRLRALLASAGGEVVLRTEQRGDDPDAVAAAAVAELYRLGAERVLAGLRK